MPSKEFPGYRGLIHACDKAVTLGDSTAITDSLRASLCHMINHHELQLPTCVSECVSNRYARRELYYSEQHHYCIVAMTWGPGQGSAIHDHCFMWCVEGLWSGMMEQWQYQRLEDREDLCQFEQTGAMQSVPGSVISLVPPHEYHALRNPSHNTPAVSLHIYSGRMTHCTTFHPLTSEQGRNGYLRRENKLPLDPVY